MNQPETNRHDPQLGQYLRLMQTLQAEMTLAMACVAQNAIADFQESVGRQETLCAELAPLAKRFGGEDSQVRDVIASLYKKNLEYAAVLKHTGRTLSLLSSLCGTYTGQHQEARGSRLKHQTWSCVM
jgi:hypothetical protein